MYAYHPRIRKAEADNKHKASLSYIVKPVSEWGRWRVRTETHSVFSNRAHILASQSSLHTTENYSHQTTLFNKMVF